MLFELGDGFEARAGERQGRLIGRALETAYDRRDAPAVERGDRGEAAQHRAERIDGRREQLDRVTGHVVGDHGAVAVEDRAAWSEQRHLAEPILLRLQPEVPDLEYLRPEEGTDQHEEDDPEEQLRH